VHLHLAAVITGIATLITAVTALIRALQKRGISRDDWSAQDVSNESAPLSGSRINSLESQRK
jgi:hypothetical protein